MIHHYPSGDHDLLFKSLCLSEDAKILDVGGGANPFKYADVIVDMDFGTGNVHRDGGFVPLKKNEFIYVSADIKDLPFQDKSFDFVICLHVLEHVEFPDKACKELMRVAKKGFIETPRKWTEYYAGHPTHRWLVDYHDNTIYFEPITYNDSPFMNFALPPLWDSSQLQERLFKNYSNIPCVQFEWDGKFDYHVSDLLPEKTYTKNFMAERHYYFALNLLHWMGDFRTGDFHIKTALNLNPEPERYKELGRFYSILTGGIKEIIQVKSHPDVIAKALLCRIFRFIYSKMLTWYRNIIICFK